MSPPRIIGAPTPRGEDRIRLINDLKEVLADILDSKTAISLSEEEYTIAGMVVETLAEALQGKIKTIAIVACFDDGFASAMMGRQASALNMACDELKAKILAAVTKTKGK